MEGLNLEDLNFDTDNLQLFDDEGNLEQSANPATTGDTPPAADAPTGDDAQGSNDIITDGDDTATAGQESVATGKDDTQVQAGKTADGKEGSDSSSPKLNETEQLYSNLAAQFKAKGVLPGLDDITKIKSLEDLNEAIQGRIDSGLTARQKAIEEAQSAGIPVGEVATKVDTIDKLKGVTKEFIQSDDSLEFRRTAIVQDFLLKGYSPERANEMTQRSIDAGTDIADAEFAVSSIIKAEETSLNNILDGARKNEQNKLDDVKKYIANTQEVVPGVVLTDTQKDELYSRITTDLGNKDNAFMQSQKSDPVGSRIRIEAVAYLTKDFTDFSIFGVRNESKITNNIENLIRGAKFTADGSVETEMRDSQSNFSLSDLKDFEIE
jgi:hypothetical protein